MINLEVKGTLAKLLATEDLIIEHKCVETACFNVNSRVLTLPIWKEATSEVYDMLIAHEVGHALYTPNEDWTLKLKSPKAYLNVTEDARIETMMKRRFGGLPKTFYAGYQYLWENDFFELGDRDPNELGVADRANLYFKVGGFLNIKFSPEEQVVIDQIAAAETFDDAIEAAAALYDLTKKDNQEDQKAPEESPEAESQQENENGEQGDDGEEAPEEPQEPQEEGEKTEREPSDGEGEEKPEDEEEVKQKENSGGDHGADDDKLKTVDGLEEKLKELASKGAFDEPTYVEYPSLDMDKIVISPTEVSNYIRECWSTYFSSLQKSRSNEDAMDIYEYSIHRHLLAFADFKREIQSEVNYMVKEFECKKSATAYARATTSRTGVLDCTKLHTYKYNDDLFKKVTNLPEGKNHGLVFVLDWSGSMCHILKDTVKQLLSLVMFCDKVNIPFDVYAFTNEWNEYDYDERSQLKDGGKFFIPSSFGLLNLLSSSASRRELTIHMENLYAMASMFDSYDHGYIPRKVGLSGTPLNESLICLHNLIPTFQRKANVEKVHCMILTDGESTGTAYTKDVHYNGETHVVVKRIESSDYGPPVFIRNRRTGMVRRIRSFGGCTVALLDDLREAFPNSTFTGFRVMERSASWYVRQASNYDDKKMTEWKKEKQVALEGFGYTKYYLVSATNLSADAEFDVAEDASKAKIKAAFSKSLKSKKNNKKILGDFIGLIA